MPHWWSPRLILRVKELELLEKQAAIMQAKGIPVPTAIQMKIDALKAKLSA